MEETYRRDEAVVGLREILWHLRHAHSTSLFVCDRRNVLVQIQIFVLSSLAVSVVFFVLLAHFSGCQNC